MGTAASSRGGRRCGGRRCGRSCGRSCRGRSRGGRRPVRSEGSGLFSVNGWLVLAAYNLIVFLIYVWDKRRAKRHGWRTPEATLLWLAGSMGAAGALAGIYGLRHKTRKPKFALGVPAMAIAQVALLWYVHRIGWW